MTSGDNGEWVRQGTPQDDNANWNEEPSEYGTAISPAEWDDYLSEQPVPVAPPRAHADGGAVTAGSPRSPLEQGMEPVSDRETDAPEDYRTDEVYPFAADAPVSATDDDEREPAQLDEPQQYEPEHHEPESGGITHLTDGEDADATEEYSTDEPVEEMTRPRPIAHDASGAFAVEEDFASESAVEPMNGGMDPVVEGDVSGGEPHVDAADYLAVDPVPADQLMDEPLGGGMDPVVEADVSGGERHVDAADYLAVDPVPADQLMDEPLGGGMDPVVEGDVSGGERHVDAADYLAVDPEPADQLTDQSGRVEDEPLMTAEDDDSRPIAFDDEPMMTTDDDEPQDIAVGDDAVVVDDHDVEEETVVTGTEDEPDLVVVDDELTQHVNLDDMDATQAVPVAAAAPVGQEHVADGLYRVAGSEETAVIGHDTYPNVNQDADVAEERQQAQLEAERQAREQRLGVVPTSSDNAIREDAGPVRVVTDRFLPSLGLFVLRIVTAGILGIASYQILGNGVDATAEYLGRTMIPEPRLVAWILGFTLGAMALLLIIGMLQRLVGLLLLVVAVGSLVFIRWGSFALFNPAVEGFVGDKDLLLAAMGLLLLTIGGGAWGVDGAFRRTRATSKAEREG